MYTLTIAEAENWVRKNLDELSENESVMADLLDCDSNELKTIISRTLPESINFIHANAPHHLLEGEFLDVRSGFTMRCDPVDVGSADYIVTFDLPNSFLRLVRCRLAAGSKISPVITTWYPDDSSVARMQENEITRADFRNPKIIRSIEHEDQYTFRVYTTPANATVSGLEYLNRYTYSGRNSGYKVSTPLVEDIINRLTGEVLLIYGSIDQAGVFLSKIPWLKPTETENNN